MVLASSPFLIIGWPRVLLGGVGLLVALALLWHLAGPLAMLASLVTAAAILGVAAASSWRRDDQLRRRNRDLDRRLAEQIAALEAEVAQREAAEAQVRQMQKIEAIGQLTGGIAHDFNNMLAVVIGSLDMARRKRDDPARFARYLDQADDGARRAAQLTQRLLAFARQQPVDRQVVDVNALVDGLSEMLRRTLGERIRITTRLDAGLWPVDVDPAQLENAILNLAVNARDAMVDGGRLTIVTANLADANGEQVTIAIEDSGCGMPAEVVARAMEPFFTTKDAGHGTGLGLAQVRGFATQAGGHVAIRSTVGEGTTVILHLPRGAEGGVAPAQPVEPVPASEGGGETVLVVEDEPQVREMSVAALRDLGYRVLAAVDGEEALALLAQDRPIDLLFTDVVMPGMDGIALAGRARTLRPGLRVVYATGYTPGEDMPVPEQGALTLAKPFTVARLAMTVRRALDPAG